VRANRIPKCPSQPQMTRRLVAFYLLTFWTGILEIVLPLCWATRQSSVWLIGLGMTVFHFGYLSRDLLFEFRIRPIYIVICCGIGTICMGIAFTLQNPAFEIATVLLVATSIRYMRAWGKGVESFDVRVNGATRQLGYIAGGLLVNQWLAIALIGVTTVTLLFTNKEALTFVKASAWPKERLRRKLVPLIVFEFFHSLHYFLYCYFLLAIFWELSQEGQWAVGFFFMLGWVGYLVLYAKVRRYYPRLVIFGHLVNAIAILAMVHTENLIWLVLLWIITGFGGGTNFSVRYGISGSYGGLAEYRELSENIGHALGPIIGAWILATLGKPSMFIFAALASLAASVSIIINESLSMIASKKQDLTR
jgi:hypothetical protein